MRYEPPGHPTSLARVEPRYDNYIGGTWVPPARGRYFEDVAPITGVPFTEVARSDVADVELAVDAAHVAAGAWAHASAAERAAVLTGIAERIDEHLEELAVVECWENGKPVREALTADIPLASDHFRYFAGAIRAQEGGISEIDGETVLYRFHEPLGVVGQIIPWNFPVLTAASKLAPALAAGNCVVLKPAEQTPWSILKLVELVADLLPDGVVNVVNGFGAEAGKPLAQSGRIAKIAFTGETATGELIAQYAAEHAIPVTLDLGGTSPSIFFSDVMDADDEYLDKAVEGMVLFAFNQGELCSCPSRALVQRSIYEPLMERVIARTEAIVSGDPLDPGTMIGAQASAEQLEKVLAYVEAGRSEGAKLLTGGGRREVPGYPDGYYVEPTILEGGNSMRIFQEEILGPVLTVTPFGDDQEAVDIANDGRYGRGAGVWTRDGSRAYHVGRQIRAGRIWTNSYDLYPAHAAFGGDRGAGIGREAHEEMLDHYQQTKHLLVSYSPKKLGLF